MQAAFRALASSLHYLRGAFIAISVPNNAPFILLIRFIHANKVQAAFEYAKSSLQIFNYLIYLNKISAKAHRACFRAAGLCTEAGK